MRIPLCHFKVVISVSTQPNLPCSMNHLLVTCTSSFLIPTISTRSHSIMVMKAISSRQVMTAPCLIIRTATYEPIGNAVDD